MTDDDKMEIYAILNDMSDLDQDIECLKEDVKYYEKELKEAQEKVDNEIDKKAELQNRLFNTYSHIPEKIIRHMDWEAGHNTIDENDV